MILASIVATDFNNAIGKDNKLLWHLPADLKFFKTTTMGCPIIMGRKTFDSIGRVLPGRKNIIISRNKDLKIEGAEVYSSFEEMMKNVKVEKAFIIGGADIYNLSMPYVTEIYRTLVKHEFEADTFFPEIKFADFSLVWEEEHFADEKNEFDYIFQKYVRV
ncbi:MAG: dihydrofolate reductase [Sphingobacteriaceae bacterium]|nr:dihydrofolate reductase [Sphingobacteriaceae bacterium]